MPEKAKSISLEQEEKVEEKEVLEDKVILKEEENS